MRILCFGLFFLLTSAKKESSGNDSEKPNIIFILADDLTRWDTGVYGSPDSKTPTIDSLAAHGMKFNKCYQAAPMCSPTRHNLITGMYPVRTGAYPNHTYAKQETKSVVQYMKPLGYRVALSGKRHILTKKVFPFEYIDGVEGKTTDPDLDKVDAFLGDVQQKDDKFCLFVNFKSPHAPWTHGNRNLFNKDEIKLPPYIADTPKTRELFRNYLAEINYLDGQIKTTMELLKKHGFDKNTIVMFATEQGNSFPFAKWTLYNAGVGSGLIVNWPGRIAPGTSDALVEYSDIVPTMIDAAGGEAIDKLDGSSLLPVLFQYTKKHKDYTYSLQTTRTIYSGSEYFPIRSVSDGKFRLILNLTPEVKFHNTVTERDRFFQDWKNNKDPKINHLAQRYQNRPAIELYDDEKDPYNMNNLADNPKYDDTIAQLRKKLQEWMSYCGDQGIRTELEANLHNHSRVQSDAVVSMVLDFSKAESEGNFEVELDGYYFFYTDTTTSVNVDGHVLNFGNLESNEYSNYSVIALKKGKHFIKAQPGINLEWSGPEMKKRNFQAVP